MKPTPWLLALLAIATPPPATGSESAALAAARAEQPDGPPAERSAALEAIPPGAVLFTASAENHVDIVRPISDVTGDGLDEILYGLRESNVPNVFLLDGASSGTATEVWSFMTTGGASNGYLYGDQCLVPSSDTDGNGEANFLMGTAGGGRVAYAIDALAHAELWRYDTYLNPPDDGWVYSLAELSDTTGDLVPEVAFGAGSFSDSLYVVDGASSGAASLLWRYQAVDAVVSVRNPGDVDGDGDDDVVAAVGDTGHQVVALDGSPPTAAGSVLWTHPTGSASVWSINLLPDADGDGISEVLAATWITGGSAVRCVDGATGATLWTSTTVPEYAMAVEPLVDVTGDGKWDVIVGSWENAVQVLDGVTGARVWKRTVGTLNGGDVWTVRQAGDLNQDGFFDVVAGSFDGYVYAYSGLNGYPFWAYSTGRRLYNVHGLGDLNGDGVPEVAASTQNLTGGPLPGVFVLDGDAGLALPLFADDFENGAPVGWSAQLGEGDAPGRR